MNKEIQQ